MASVIVRGLDDHVKAQLATQAKENGRSMEAEVRDILTKAALRPTIDMALLSMAWNEGRVIGHVGWARREIAVGTQILAIAGVGGVLISADARGTRLGSELMSWAAQSMRDGGRVAFGYLGCRDQVVPFYASCGWKKIRARERSVGCDGEPVEQEPGPPILVLPIAPFEMWPDGDIDLRGRAW